MNVIIKSVKVFIKSRKLRLAGLVVGMEKIGLLFKILIGRKETYGKMYA